MEFRCRLGTPGGEIIEGLYVADSEARLRREFEEKGLYVLGLHRAGRARFAGIALPRRARIATREFVVFNQELATLLKAGMPLVQSLDILRRRATNPVFKAVLDDVNDRVRAGSSLSESFEAHGALFPGVYTASLLAGEKSGNLEQVIRRYVSYVKVVANVKRKTVSALVYPLILLALSMVVVSIIMLRVVPAFGEFYSQFGEDLPLSTRVIVAISSFASSYFLPIVIVVALVAVGAWQWLQRPGKREWFDRMVLRLPGLGGIAQKFATSQAARTLATLLGGGIPLVNAIDVSARSIRNQYMAHELRSAAQQVREGRALALAMSDSGAFPDVAIKMVEVGESTGALQEMLNSLADFYDEEIETNLGRFVTLVEPILLIVMGLVIAGLLLSLYMPLFNLSNALR
jgi:type IV pilus assembly protein PilC